MANRFVAMVFAVLKDKGVDVDGLSVNEAVEIFNRLNETQKNKRVPKETLSRWGWKRFYNKLGEMRYGIDGDVTYMPNGVFSFEVENKFLLISGTYVKPVVFAAVSSALVEEELGYLQRLEDVHGQI